MNTKPIIFSAPMIRALLAGTKKQTRRVMKPQPYSNGFHFDGYDILCHCDELPPSAMLLTVGKGRNRYTTSNYEGWESSCPYGDPGDLLWVKETWRPRHALSIWDLIVTYAADGSERRILDGAFPEDDWTMPKAAARGNVSPLFMPRRASRLTLQLTDVRVQRLQDISEAYACAEGLRVFNEDDAILYYSALATEAEWPTGWHLNPVDAFRELWQSINGPESWDVNPWVWALSFRVIHANVDAVLADPAAHGAEVRNVA